MNLNQVTVPVSDIAKSTAFYRLLGLNLIVYTDHYARFECPDGDSTFSIHRVDSVSLATGLTIYFECEDLNERVSELREAGVAFSEEPVDKRYLWREARLSDPDGNSLCLYWAGENRKNPPWKVGVRDL